NRAAPAGVTPDPVQTRLLAAGGTPQHLVAVLVERDVVERDDVRGPLPRRGELELADGRLDVPRIGVAALAPECAEAKGPRARQPRELGARPVAEREHVQPVGSRAKGVLLAVSDLHDGVAAPDLAHLAVLPEKPGPVEDEVRLLRDAV